MAGFEVVVRPVVFPNIRPAPAQSQVPQSDPTTGLVVIHGASGQHIDLPFSWSLSTSTQRHSETKRRFDEVRVYQKDDDGTVDKNTFIDVEVPDKIWMSGSPIEPYGYAPIQEADNIEIRKSRQIRTR